jgi:hypothetical protein
METTVTLTYAQRIKQIEKETAYFRYKLHLIQSMQIKIDPLNKLYGDLDAKEKLYRTQIQSNERKVENLISCTDNLKNTLITYTQTNGNN